MQCSLPIQCYSAYFNLAHFESVFNRLGERKANDGHETKVRWNGIRLVYIRVLLVCGIFSPPLRVFCDQFPASCFSWFVRPVYGETISKVGLHAISSIDRPFLRSELFKLWIATS